MAEQHEARPAGGLTQLIKIVQPVDEDIGGRLVIRVTVPRQIDADQVELGEMRGKGQEAGAVVEPAVQGDQQRLALLIIVQQGDVAPVIEGDGPLAHHHQR
ncbi:hypothetical protein D3C78_1398470 [compost metagenome]